jgi:hypothetical protein
MWALSQGQNFFSGSVDVAFCTLARGFFSLCDLVGFELNQHLTMWGFLTLEGRGL